MTLDRKSVDFTGLARQLLSEQRSRKSETSHLTEEDAVKVIELIEPTVCPIVPVFRIGVV